MTQIFYRIALAFEYVLFTLLNMTCFILLLDWRLVEEWGLQLNQEFMEYYGEDQD